jgi:hypothetical protein
MRKEKGEISVTGLGIDYSPKKLSPAWSLSFILFSLSFKKTLYIMCSIIFFSTFAPK